MPFAARRDAAATADRCDRSSRRIARAAYDFAQAGRSAVTSLEILGCRLDPIDADDATARILALARERRELAGRHARHRDGRLRAAATRAFAQSSTTARSRSAIRSDCSPSLDGAVRRLRERVTGVELIERLCAGAAAQGCRSIFLGGATGVAADAAAILRSRFPGLLVAGTRNGYFREDETSAVVRRSQPAARGCSSSGMGSPRQEYWLAEHLRETGCGAGIGVGGSFDVIAGRIERAPQLVRRLGLEWLYRLVKEPRRWRRQLALPRFVWLVALDELGFRPVRKEARRLVKAMILAGGLSTRLYPLTKLVPKPLVPVAGVPNAAHLIRYLKAYGFDEIAINVHYLAEAIVAALGDGSRFGVKLHYSLRTRAARQRRRREERRRASSATRRLSSSAATK